MDATFHNGQSSSEVALEPAPAKEKLSTQSSFMRQQGTAVLEFLSSPSSTYVDKSAIFSWNFGACDFTHDQLVCIES